MKAVWLADACWLRCHENDHLSWMISRYLEVFVCLSNSVLWTLCSVLEDFTQVDELLMNLPNEFSLFNPHQKVDYLKDIWRLFNPWIKADDNLIESRLGQKKNI